MDVRPADGMVLAWFPECDPCASKEEAESVKLDLQRVLFVQGQLVVAFRISWGLKRFNLKEHLLFYRLNELQSAHRERKWVVHDIEPFLAHHLAMTDAFKAKHQEEHDVAWTAIRGIAEKLPSIYLSRADRGRFIREAAAAHGVSKPAIRKWLAMYWMAGKNDEALYPRFYECGSPGRPHASKTLEDDRQKLVKGFYQFAKLGVEAAYQKTLEKFFSAGQPVKGGPLIKTDSPPKGVFVYHGGKASKNDLKNFLVKQLGNEEFQNRWRPRLGSMRQGVAGPGDKVQVDCTIDDMYLASQFDPDLPIGRPIYYTVADVFSNASIGFNVGLEMPQWVEGASLAVLCAILPKFELYQELGVDEALYDFLGITLTREMLPYQGVMVELCGDQELNSKNAGGPLEGLGVILTTTPPRRPWTKGLVEQKIDQWQEAYKPWAPGAVDERRKAIRHRHFALDAKFNLRDFAQLVAIKDLMGNLALIKGYQLDLDMRADKVSRRPIDLWNHGIENRVGPLRQISRDMLEARLLPLKEATIRPDGLLLEGYHYLPEVDDLYNRFIAARFGLEAVKVHCHPRRPGRVFLHDRGERRIIPFVLNTNKHDAGYADMYWEDLVMAKALDGAENEREEHSRRQRKSDFHHVINKFEERADERRRDLKGTTPKPPMKERLAIRENRQKETASGGGAIILRQSLERPLSESETPCTRQGETDKPASRQRYAETLRKRLEDQLRSEGDPGGG